jgi:hypothetical protein
MCVFARVMRALFLCHWQARRMAAHTRLLTGPGAALHFTLQLAKIK